MNMHDVLMIPALIYIVKLERRIVKIEILLELFAGKFSIHLKE